MKLIGLMLALCLQLSVFVSGQEDLKTEAPKSKCLCTYRNTPVCASNSITYPNYCSFDCARRELESSGDGLFIVKRGRC
ncbi:uncharacterized protein LOC6566661 [Drosophila grimshawi]|uniref:GH13068 n=1 Tax=Drosophila grimshawi TaxID=7222 RepID=B4JR35_DROGR|nr:uncharacterized protein LOC6566661 [Drosophila grimshawi]EDV99365.1 GH13068 [Drosophila grimshawi]